MNHLPLSQHGLPKASQDGFGALPDLSFIASFLNPAVYVNKAVDGLTGGISGLFSSQGGSILTSQGGPSAAQTFAKTASTVATESASNITTPLGQGLKWVLIGTAVYLLILATPTLLKFSAIGARR